MDTKASKPLSQMTNNELMIHRMALETLDGGCQDWEVWQAMADENRKRGLVLAAAKCEGRAWNCRANDDMSKAQTQNIYGA